MDLNKFKDIRPYIDAEIPPALARIASNPLFESISSYLFPNKDVEFFRTIFLSCKTCKDFQVKIMSAIVAKILTDTAKKLTSSGIENYNDGYKHLIISNHRDIVLDSAIIQVLLNEYKFQTTEIAVGDNLITSPFIEDLARCNKMIKVVRSTSPREVYTTSQKLSEYIRSSVSENDSSIWIAQRNGRTKDGDDLTEQGLLKMLAMSGGEDFTLDFEQLHILPMAISYEYEPCDLLKAVEIYISRRMKYVKGKDEDLNSILTGIMQFKGNIHVSFTKPLSKEEIEASSTLDKNERFKQLASVIDERIISAYKLWKTNYIAYDLLEKGEKYSHHYTDEDKQAFISYVNFKIAASDGDINEIKEIFLSIYANPVKSKEKLLNL